MPTQLICAGLLLAVATAAFAGPAPPGEALPPGAVHRNETGDMQFVLLELAPARSFANDTDHEFRVLAARELAVLAEEAADPRLLAHEEAIAVLRGRLADLDSTLDGVAADRDALREESP